MNRNTILFFLLIAGFANMSAQEVLTVENAVKIALENNYDIKIAANELKIDQQNASAANAGMLPRIDAQVTDNHSIQDISQTRADGNKLSMDGGKNQNLNYGANLGWTVFDGFRMFARYDQLKELEKLGDAELKLTILDRVGEVMTTYFDIVQQQQQLAALDSTIILSNQRVELSRNRYTIGKAAKLEVLNAQVDLNTDQTNLLRQQELLANTKTRLNELLGRDVKTDFRVMNSASVDQNLLLPDLAALAEKQNPALLAQIINKRVAELNLKQVRANRYPTIGVSTGYNWSESKSSLGFTSESYAKGLNYGFSASINVFNGFLQKRNERIAQLQVDNSAVAIAQQRQAINSQLTSAYQTYITNIQLINVESKNEEIARQNLDITMEKYRIGTITTLEYRTAQLNYLNAKIRHSNAQFQAKLSEISLKQLAGNLSLSN